MRLTQVRVFCNLDRMLGGSQPSGRVRFWNRGFRYRGFRYRVFRYLRFWRRCLRLIRRSVMALPWWWISMPIRESLDPLALSRVSGP